MKLRWIPLAIVIASATELHAGHRFLFEPSLQVNEVDDDNLNFSIDEPLRDRIHRVTPGLELGFDSPRWRLLGSYSLDSEHYVKYSRLDSDRARERAAIGVEYRVAPRLTLFMNSAYLNTNTLADLNVDTGLSASRVRGRRLSLAPSAAFLVSPRVKATAGASSTATNVVNGMGTRTQAQTLGLERRSTLRDRLSIDYEHSHVVFTGVSSQMIDTHTMLAGWTHDFAQHDRLILQAGPRITNHAPSVDLSASVTHAYRFSSVGLSFVRTQMTVVGYAGAVDTQSLQAHFTLTPTRRLSAYIAPALVRNTQRQLEATVARAAIGARCAITSLTDFEVSYNHDHQTGTLDLLRPDAKISHSTFSIGFVTRTR